MSIGHAMGLDIGGSGVKAAVVDLGDGKLLSERVRIPTPQPSTPEAVLETADSIRRQIGWSGPIGCGFPGSFESGKVDVAPNLDPSWSGIDLARELRRKLGADRVAIANDADAAGLAEMRFGAGRGVPGTVIVVTLGTGIGTALFRNSRPVPGTELGHLEIDGRDAELLASSRARKENCWSWEDWGRRVDRYLARLEYLLNVDRFVIGGGASKKKDKFFPYFEKVGCKVAVATMGNLAGIVGAALLMAEDGA